ncbi:MAG: nucleoside-diphosphate kinase [Spartobacteria bacterium]|nr:nucleoside-diphosphate kinase [Spartobacteria bacterium]
MAHELAFVLINPYTIGKSRTGGVIGRIIAQTGLDLVAARMFGPSQELVNEYAGMLRTDPDVDAKVRELLADYVLRAYSPDPKTGRCRRVMMLLFEGENAIRRVYEAAGNIRENMESGRTVRDIYGDYVVDESGKVLYIEPAVLIGPTAKSAIARMRLWAEYSAKDGGIIENCADLPEAFEKTLVLIKPDNFRFPSTRPGNIIDLFSGSGLRIVGARVLRMSVAQAEQFYGPVRDVLRNKLKGMVAARAMQAISQELKMDLPEELSADLGDLLGPVFGDQQFYEIIQFMTGRWPPTCPHDEKDAPGKEKCLALVYAGPDAVNIIRGILGPTDPSKAAPGSVRREYGQTIMVNAAHASDSPSNSAREMDIIKANEDKISYWVEKYYPQEN